MRLQLDPLHQLVLVIDSLRERDVEHGPCRPVEPPSRELRVSHHTNDPERADVFRQVESEVLVEGILVASEEPPHERFVHNRDRCGGLIVRGGERSTSNRDHAEVLKIVRAHPVP